METWEVTVLNAQMMVGKTAREKSQNRRNDRFGQGANVVKEVKKSERE